jgi:hypothetical protein
MDALEDALKDATDDTVWVAKREAPIYQPYKYPTWAKMSHARRTPGGLKASIKRKSINRTPRTMSTGIYSRKRYSSYVHDGFRHNRAKRWIPGKEFIKIPIELVHKKLFPMLVVRAFEKAYRI